MVCGRVFEPVCWEPLFFPSLLFASRTTERLRLISEKTVYLRGPPCLLLESIPVCLRWSHQKQASKEQWKWEEFHIRLFIFLCSLLNAINFDPFVWALKWKTKNINHMPIIILINYDTTNKEADCRSEIHGIHSVYYRLKNLHDIKCYLHL